MLLEIKNLYKSYRLENAHIEVLSGISFGLERNTLRVLLGRSGQGKSTLLRLCAGYEKQDSGEILFEGKPVTKPSHERFMVFQDYDQLFPWRRAQDNIEFAIRSVYPVSRSEARERAEFWLKETEMQNFGNLWPSELSGGMHQRVALARAFALSPKLLLLDEPFSALDARLRATIQELLKGLCQKHGITALFVTHDIDEALRLDPTPAVLTDNGRQIIEIKQETNTRQVILALLAEEIYGG